MGTRTGRRVKPATRLTVPGVIFAVVPHSDWSARYAREGLFEARWQSADVAVSYRRRGKWSAPKECRVCTPDALRATLEEWAIPGRTNWVIAPNAPDLLTLSKWWSYAESNGITFDSGERRKRATGACGPDRGGVRVSQIVCSGRCGILDYTQWGTHWRYVSASNYWPDCDVDGQSARRSDAGRERGTADGRSSESPPAGCRAQPLLSRAIVLCDWWERTATAPLATTASGLAWGILRSDAGATRLCTHSDAAVHTLERCAAHGGRASVWYVGQVRGPSGDGRAAHVDSATGCAARCDGPVTHVDVTSMYPALLRDMAFPCSLRSVRGEMRPDEVLGLADGGGVIARVTLRTRAAEYPLRRGERTIYPLGQFVTTLAGPDLNSLARDGDIIKVHMVATYAMGRPFKGAMDSLLVAREHAKRACNKDAVAFSKLVANSLGGRLAMRQGKWVRQSKRDEPGRWGEYHSLDVTRGTATRYRYLAGACWSWDAEEMPRGPHTAAFAYLTAYGRQQMRTIRAELPAQSVVCQNTDGLYLLPLAVAKLVAMGISDDAAPGQLRIVGSADSGQWYGPGHYRWGTQWVLSGFSSPTAPDDALRVTYSTHTPLFGRGDREAPDRVTMCRVTTSIPRGIDNGRVMPDGWVLPPHILPSREV